MNGLTHYKLSAVDAFYKLALKALAINSVFYNYVPFSHLVYMYIVFVMSIDLYIVFSPL